MSEIGTIFAPLEQHNLEVVAFQWDGTREQAILASSQLRQFLSGVGAGLTVAHVRASTQYGVTLDIAVQRRVDGQQFEPITMRRGGWLAIWLHEGQVHDVELLGLHDGERLFRRVRPVVTLHPTMKEIDGDA